MRDDLELSKDATEEAKKIREAILKVLGPDTYTGGCKAFYTPKEWAARGEVYGRTSKLIVCHDGGDLAVYFNYDYGAYTAIDRMIDGLKAIGYYGEPCGSWYTAIYPI